MGKGIEPATGKLIAIVFAILLILLGTKLVSGENAPISTIIVLLSAAMVLIIEQGLKKFTKISKEKIDDFSLADWIGLTLVLVLVIVALGGLVWNIPTFIQNISEFAVIISGIFVAYKAFF